LISDLATAQNVLWLIHREKREIRRTEGEPASALTVNGERSSIRANRSMEDGAPKFTG
jgi:hypothetical protein